MSGWKEANPGDCISSIAFENGHFWQTIWGDPSNKDLKTLRKDPNILLKGDRVFVPDLRPRVESRPTEKRHVFVRKGVPARIKLCLTANKQPRSNVPYTLVIDGKSYSGTTDAGGHLEHPIPPNAKSGKLLLTENGLQQVQDLNLGHMDPITELSGVQRRLVNLGYECDIGGDTVSRKMQKMLRSFQSDHRLVVNGKLDDNTRQQIQQAHGN